MSSSSQGGWRFSAIPRWVLIGTGFSDRMHFGQILRPGNSRTNVFMLGFKFERIHGYLGIACQDPPQVTNGRRFTMMPPSCTALTFNNWLILGSSGGNGQFRQLSSMTQPSIVTAIQKNATRKSCLSTHLQFPTPGSNKIVCIALGLPFS